jgi:hypothetical protein
MAYHRLTRENYEKLLAFYRAHPGDIGAAARHCGIGKKQARKAWEGPPYDFREMAWAVPIREVLTAEKDAAEITRVARESELAREREEALARARDMENEAVRLEEGILRLARGGVHGGFDALAKLQPGIDALAKRLAVQLAAGVDALGAPIHLDPNAALRVIRQYVVSTRELVNASHVLSQVLRLKDNLPTAIVGVDVSHVTLETAVAQFESTAGMLAEARKLGILPARGSGAAESAPSYAEESAYAPDA